MCPSRRVLLACALLLCVPMVARGEDANDTVPDAPVEVPGEDSAPARQVPVDIETLEVTERTLGEVADATAFATVIEVERQAEEFKTVAQVLAETAGLQVRRFGGLGDFATVSVRGASSGQVRIYFDDVPLTRARSETVNLADLPLEPLQRIEVYRGTTPLSVGASALGGIINLITKDPTDTPSIAFLAGGGSFGTRQASLTASGRLGDWGLLGSFNYLGSEGDFPFDDDNGTPVNPNDDERVRRENNAFNSGDVILKAVRDVSSRARIIGLNEFFINDQGVPGIGAFQSQDANLFDLRNLTYVRFEGEGLEHLPTEFDATLYFIYEEERFDDPKGDLGLGRRKTRFRTFATGANAHGAQTLGDHLLEGRIDFGGEVLVPRDLLASDPMDATQSRFSFDIGLGDTWGLLDGDLLLDGQLRYELIHDDFGGFVDATGEVTDESTGGTRNLFTPRLGARYTVLDWLWLKTNVGRYGRFPNFSELFGNRGSIVGNPDLTPETGWNIDVGIDAQARSWGPLDRVRTEAVFFWRDVDDLILLIQNSQRTSVPRNISGARIWGIELQTAFEAWERVGFSANYTYQDTRDESAAPSRNGKQLPGIPQNEAYLRVDYHPWDLVPFYELSFASDNFLDPANLIEVPSRLIHSLGLRYDIPWTPLTLTFEARNITNNQIEDVAGFPLPGRSFFGTVAYRWTGAAEETPS